ncbi:MAG: hypothetical protein ACYCO9_04015 [Streptosporangiaceae bacterium]
MAHGDLAWANLSAADDPALVTWLADPSCDPHVKALPWHDRAAGTDAPDG